MWGHAAAAGPVCAGGWHGAALASDGRAYRVQATVWPVVSEPATKKMENSSISRSRLRGLPLLPLSRSR